MGCHVDGGRSVEPPHLVYAFSAVQCSAVQCSADSISIIAVVRLLCVHRVVWLRTLTCFMFAWCGSAGNQAYRRSMGAIAVEQGRLGEGWSATIQTVRGWGGSVCLKTLSHHTLSYRESA